MGRGLARPFDRMQRIQLMDASGLDCFEKQPPARGQFKVLRATEEAPLIKLC